MDDPTRLSTASGGGGGEGAGGGSAVARMIVQECPYNGDESLARCRMHAPGIGTGLRDYLVEVAGRREVDTVLLAARLVAGGGKFHGGRPVAWVELTGSADLPTPTAMYQVLTPIDATLKPVWTWLRFH